MNENKQVGIIFDETMIEQLPTPLIMVTKETGEIIYVNESAQKKWSGLSHETQPSMIVDFFQEPQDKKYVNQKINGEEVIKEKLPNLTDKVGKNYWVKMGASEVEIEDQTIVMLTLNDMTEQVEIEQNLLEERAYCKKRIRELKCVQKVMKLTEDPRTPLDTIGVKIVDEISKSFTHRKFVNIHLVLEGKDYESKGYRPSDKGIQSKKRTAYGSYVILKASYQLETGETAYFSTEERALLVTIVKQLVNFLNVRHLLKEVDV